MNSNVKGKVGKETKPVSPKKPATSVKGLPNVKGQKKKATLPSKGKRGDKREIAGQHFNGAEAVLAYGEIFSMEDAATIARKDLELGQVSTDKDYVQANSWQYYLGINTWYLVVSDSMHATDPRGVAARTLIALIRSIGLVATIALCCDTAQRLVQEREIPDRVRFLVTDNMQTTLQNLRFLKRFTVLKADRYYARDLKSWLSTEKRCKSLNTRNHTLNSKYNYVMGYIRDVLDGWLKDYKPVAVDDELPPIPSGATFEKDDAGKSLALSARLKQYVRRAHDGRRFVFASADPDWETPYDLRYKDAVEEVVDVVYEETNIYTVSDDGASMVLTGCRYRNPSLRIHYRRYKILRDKRVNRLLFVPKNYKVSRTVCPESPINQMMQRKIRDHVWDCLPRWVKRHIPLRDQTVMERLAAAAFTLNLSTTDLSHASDSFLVSVFCDAFPTLVKRDVMRWRPTHTAITDVEELHTLQQLSTMGTGNVWLLMAIFLLAAMVVACKFGRVPKSRINGCFAFGDDLIHPSEIADILYWILSLMGFEVNVDKSYGSGSRYRESCGSEWWLTEENGEPVVQNLRTLYYPRFPVATGNNKLAPFHWDYDVANDMFKPVDGLSRLIALQHNLYYAAPAAADFLARAVKRLEPRMTTSLAGTPCDDLWGEIIDGPITNQEQLWTPQYDKAGRRKPVPTWFDPELNSEVPVTTRVGHMVLTVEDTATTTADATQREWMYLLFLQKGPTPVGDSWMPYNSTKRQRMVDPQTLSIKWKMKF